MFFSYNRMSLPTVPSSELPVAFRTLLLLGTDGADTFRPGFHLLSLQPSSASVMGAPPGAMGSESSDAWLHSAQGLSVLESSKQLMVIFQGRCLLTQLISCPFSSPGPTQGQVS